MVDESLGKICCLDQAMLEEQDFGSEHGFASKDRPKNVRDAIDAIMETR
jgi:hypothetical protein